MHDCETEDSNHLLNYARTDCVLACESGEFFENTGKINSSKSYAYSC